ncbi:MAG: aspartate kinase [Bacteroidota bacterium]
MSLLSPQLDVFVAGVGGVGRALLAQIRALPPDRSPLRLIGAATRSGSVFAPNGLAPGALLDALATSTSTDWPVLLRQLEAHATTRRTLFVDATGAGDVADYTEHLLAAGISVVTPSKLANTRSQDLFDRLRQLGDGTRAHYRYETTVGAGLPVIRTVTDLIDTGDRLRSVRGVVSGTMTYLFHQLERGTPFSVAVRSAVEQGYAEPDPRDDLSGEDVARKLLILARTAGLRVERSDVAVDSLVPDAARDVPLTLVTDALAEADAAWAERAEAATAQGLRLRYVGRIERDGSNGTASWRLGVGVEAVPADSPLGGLRGTDNLIEITTDRYALSPLVVQGPGAGPAVTAAGVLADVLTVARAVRPIHRAA